MHVYICVGFYIGIVSNSKMYIPQVLAGSCVQNGSSPLCQELIWVCIDTEFLTSGIHKELFANVVYIR